MDETNLDLDALATVLDEIIPPSADGRMPGAGELGIAEALGRDPELAPVLAGGLDALARILRERGRDDLAALPRPERRSALEASAGEAPAFLPTLVAQTLLAYYRHERVLRALGLRPGAPFPRGYEVASTDFAILAPVREREPIYREP